MVFSWCSRAYILWAYAGSGMAGAVEGSMWFPFCKLRVVVMFYIGDIAAVVHRHSHHFD